MAKMRPCWCQKVSSTKSEREKKTKKSERSSTHAENEDTAENVSFNQLEHFLLHSGTNSRAWV